MSHQEPDFQNLKKLWTLKLVVETGSLKSAAQKSKVSLSAVSQSLSSLEKNLGRKLILRVKNKLEPTQFTRDLLHSISPAFDIFSSLSEASFTDPLKIPMIKSLNFGTTDCVAATTLPNFVIQVKSKLPKIKLTLRVDRSENLVRMVKKGDLCMAIVNSTESLKGVSTFPLYEDRLGIYVSAKHPIAERGIGAIQDFGIASIIPAQEGYPSYYSSFLRAIDSHLRPMLTCDSYETLYAMAASGTIAAILPERFAQRHNGVLKEINLANKKRDKLGKFQVSMISQKGCDPQEDQFLLAELRSIL